MANQSDFLPTWYFSSLLKELYVKLMTKHEQSSGKIQDNKNIKKTPHCAPKRLLRLYIELF